MRIFLLLPLIAVVNSKTYLVETDDKPGAKTPGAGAGDYSIGDNSVGEGSGDDYALEDVLALLTKPETLSAAGDILSSVIESGKAGDIANLAVEALGAVLKPKDGGAGGAGAAPPPAGGAGGAGGDDYALNDLLEVATKPETLKGAADVLGAVVESGKVPDLVNFAVKALGALLKPAEGGADKNVEEADVNPPIPPVTGGKRGNSGNRGGKNAPDTPDAADAADAADNQDGSGEGSGANA
ncbi:uncharacterized protein LOC111714164 isoform X2 [Eurytemora carolleeae]|uniref:uncharacterized protein LOC111714164 isoform X2 n=1 Tax=Eurytemora carolleeae TaxID=1294199 RepID=UPI000C780CC8|nr:uncharacterized protein LOC111714164 isoform X2 [Eurytemora carolleeae]|eukprot:XP_023344982.1 uncharacterized protein LOC111714164 isoform X2 [Eurytemora affinis]